MLLLGQSRGMGLGWLPQKLINACVLWSGFFLSCRIRLRYILNGVSLWFPSESQASKYTMLVLWRR